MVLSLQQIHDFQEKILSWYAIHQRELPWRRTREPYPILVSEVMLQQTQVQRVIPKYQAWLLQFPTIHDLSRASTGEVLEAWSGLGYNRRALFLQKTARALSEDYQGIWPQEYQSLLPLPGIGDYTARAVACFAFNQQIAVIDTNVRKVLSIEFFNGNPPDTKTVQVVAEALLPSGKAYEWNQALMDYSNLVLKSEKIPVPKQSPYRTSRRFYRGKILKLLVQQKQTTEEELIGYFTKNYGEPLYPISEIVLHLEKEGLIQRNGKKITL